MYQETSDGTQLVKKPTGFMTNATAIAEILLEKCRGDHSHVTLVGGRARVAEVYPDELCFRILKGLLRQMKRDGRIKHGHIGAVWAEEEDRAWDDQTGEELDAGMVKEARREEIAEVHKHRVYDKVPIKECWDKTGKPPVGIRWVDTQGFDGFDQSM